jgi:uncharacterized protein YjbJ (UPF0337 family)
METGALLRLSNREEIPAMTDSSTRDRAEGLFDEGKGKGKQAWGDLTDNERMKGEGMIDEMKGKGEGLLGDLKDAAGDLMDDAGKMKDDIDRKTR